MSPSNPYLTKRDAQRFLHHPDFSLARKHAVDIMTASLLIEAARPRPSYHHAMGLFGLACVQINAEADARPDAKTLRLHGRHLSLPTTHEQFCQTPPEVVFDDFLEFARHEGAVIGRKLTDAIMEPDAIPEEGNLFERRGSVWRICFRGHQHDIPHLDGMMYLGALLSIPNTVISVEDLFGVAHSRQLNQPDLKGGLETAIFPMRAEHFRQKVGQAIRRALGAIHSYDSDLGDHLKAHIATGTTCQYSGAETWRIKISG